MQGGHKYKFIILSPFVWEINTTINDGLYEGFNSKHYSLVVDIGYFYILC